jgi:ribosomal protein S1
LSILSKFTARIIAVDTSTKIVRFSINHHILALDGRYAAFTYPVGTIIKNAQVIRVDQGIGALLALPSSEIDTAEPYLDERRKLDKELSNDLLSESYYRDAAKVRAAYVHISKSMDNTESNAKKGKQNESNNNRTPEALFARHFSINTRVKALRILSTSNLIDGIASCATAQSIVNAHVLTHADIVPGKIYKDVPVVQLLESGGVLVDLGIGTKGIIPSMHLFDKASQGSVDASGDVTISGYRQKIRQQKYKVGNLVTVRCLTVDPASRQCVLTAKKTLLANDIDDPIVQYPVDQERVAAGFLSKVDDAGLTITFYNNVHGRVTSRSLASELGVEDPRQNYNVGDAIVARVVSCERRRNRTVCGDDNIYFYQLKLSLKTIIDKKFDHTSGSLSQVSDGSAVPFAAGSIVMPKRMKVLQIVNCLSRDDGAFFSGYGVVSIKSKFFTGLPGNTGDSLECKLPFDQLLDSYEDELSNPPIELNEIGRKILTVGKRIDLEGVILTIPSGVDSLPVISLRPTLIKTIKSSSSDDSSVICPYLKSNLFIGKYVCGYVTRIDERFGAFVRFLDGLTGLIPKLKKGLNEKLFDTIFCKVTALDISSSPPKILLKKVTENEASKKKKKTRSDQIQVGDVVGDVKVVDINFARAKVSIVGNDMMKLRARIHVTMANALETKSKLSKKEKHFKEEHKIGKSHPFYNWKVGDIIPGVRCVFTDTRDGIAYVELANRIESGLPAIVIEPSHLPPGSSLSAIVTSAAKSSSNHGLWVQVCPGVSGFIPALEVSTDPDVLNELATNFKVGSRITCCVMEQTGHNKLPVSHHLQKDDHDSTKDDHKALFLSMLLVPGEETVKRESGFKPKKPQRGDIVIGRINKKSIMQGPPSLMMTLRGGFIGRCCITEIADENEWTNMPFGPVVKIKEQKRERVVSDSDADHENGDDESSGSYDENDR